MSGFKRWLSQTSQSSQHTCASGDTEGASAPSGNEVSQKSQVSQSRAREHEKQPPTGETPATPVIYDDGIRKKKRSEIQRVRESHPATAATFATPPRKGHCCECGQLVTWLGPLAGLGNWLGEAVHLHCATPPPEPAAPQPDPGQFDEEGYAAMRQDLITVIKELAAEGKRVGQIARMFGLKPHEVWGVLRGQRG
jgi:hypothetical protein